jgi:3-methyladenine DNA glycosylase AlkC
MTTERFSLKDHLFNAEKVAYLGGLLEPVVPDFDRDRFERQVVDAMPALELKQRIALIASVLGEHLATDFPAAAAQIRAALPPPLDPSLKDDDFGDFIFAPFGKYIEDNGTDDYDTAMGLLRDLTMRFSMEGSIRPFIEMRPEETLQQFETWARDPNYHVRRLVSESTRPRLPWAPRINLDPGAPMPLLDILHADGTRYVTRSVANHLNDISKIEPVLALEALSRWREEGRQDAKELSWMESHALRTLVKKGDPASLTFLGFPPLPPVTGHIVIAEKRVPIGKALAFDVTLTATADTALIVDYAIGFSKRNGEVGRRVFKLRKLQMGAGENVSLTKSHPLKGDATTYRLYPGRHTVELLANGTPLATADFNLVE